MIFFLPGITHEPARTYRSANPIVSTYMKQHLPTWIKQLFLGRARATKTACISLRLTAIVVGLLLTMMPLLTGCAPEQHTSSGSPAATPVGATASLEWQPVQDPSVIAYFVHYGKQSPGQPGSCTYESSMYVDSPSATVTNLDPNTTYYFAVSAYNGLESPCSEEVSTVTAPPPSLSNQSVPLA
jgi:hypothetical protein